MTPISGYFSCGEWSSIPVQWGFGDSMQGRPVDPECEYPAGMNG